MSSTRFIHFAMLAAISGTLLLGGSSGCSVYMAANQPAKKNISVLNPGTPRTLVIAELGAPLNTEKRDGKTVDLFAFTQGYSGGVKASRAAFHLAADVFTAGLWEVVATPGEAVFSGTDVKLEVTYSLAEQVEQVRPFEGADEITPANQTTKPLPGHSIPVSSSSNSAVGASPAQAASAPAAEGRDFRARLASSEWSPPQGK